MANDPIPSTSTVPPPNDMEIYVREASEGSKSGIDDDGENVPEAREVMEFEEDAIMTMIKEHKRHLELFKFDTARDTVENFRVRLSKMPQYGKDTWAAVCNCIAQVTMADKNYYHLTFLTPKLFFRKEDSLQKSYTQMTNDFKNLATVAPEGGDCQRILFQLHQYVKVRSQMIKFYIHLANNADRDWEDITRNSEDLLEKSDSGLHSVYFCEVELLVMMLRFQCYIIDGNLAKCIMLTKQITDKFVDWIGGGKDQLSASLAVSKSKKKVEKYITKFRLVNWLLYFFDHLHAKFSLYYLDSMGPYLNPMDMENMLTKPHTSATQPWYLSMCRDYLAKRTEEDFLYIIMDRSDRDGPFYGFKFVQTENRFTNSMNYMEPIRGHAEQYPILLKISKVFMVESNTHPQIHKHDPIYEELDNLLPRTNKKFHENPKHNRAYYCERLEEDIYGIFAAVGVRGKAESSVLDFLNELGLFVRGHRIFQTLKNCPQ
ncbi:unnamed protein product, partial [Mesorhabditis spiculigera]